MDWLASAGIGAAAAGLIGWLAWLAVRANDRTTSRVIVGSLRGLQDDLDAASDALTQLSETLGSEGPRSGSTSVAEHGRSAALAQMAELISRFEGPQTVRRPEVPDIIGLAAGLASRPSSTAQLQADALTLHRILADLYRTEALWIRLVEGPPRHGLAGRPVVWAGEFGVRSEQQQFPMFEGTRAVWMWLRGRLDAAEGFEPPAGRDMPTAQHPLHWTKAPMRGRRQGRRTKAAMGL
jgi:hypothetical protein